METKYHNLGEFLKEYRRGKAMTQEKMAEIIGCTRARYTLYETGKAKAGLDMIFKISVTTGKSTEFINKLNDYQGKPKEE